MSPSLTRGKVIVRIKGGLGNQLFCYATARRLALANNVELVIDDVTGFVRDNRYHRKCMLNRFNIEARRATPGERLEPFERWRRIVLKRLSRRKPFGQRRYLEEEGIRFDERILVLKVGGSLYLDGYWQDVRYFRDVEQAIREDLRISPPTDERNQRVAASLRSDGAVALHVRWFDSPGSALAHNVSVEYYRRAIALMDSIVGSPRYFLFSDDLDAALSRLGLPRDRVTSVSHNRGDDNAYADLWLLTQCRHLITANSTFSWWGAYLAGPEAVVVAPTYRTGCWPLPEGLPESWIGL